jgi:hypothetical protein
MNILFAHDIVIMHVYMYAKYNNLFMRVYATYMYVQNIHEYHMWRF